MLLVNTPVLEIHQLNIILHIHILILIEIILYEYY